MAKPHGRDCPDRCSQCAEVAASRVDIEAGVITVDGVPKRANVEPESPQVAAARRRSGNVRRRQP